MKNIFFILLLGIAVLGVAKDDNGIKKAKGYKKYTLTVRMTTGQTVELKTRFNIDYCNKVMFLYDENDNPIYPQNTISIERTFKDGTVIKGYPTDSIWIFKAFEGTINGYSTKPERKMKHVEFLTKNESGMVAYDLETLRSMLSDNQEALGLYYKHITQRKMAKNIYAASFLIGLAHVYVPITRTKSSGAKEDVIFFPPLAFIGILWAANCNRKAKLSLREAIKVYNK